RSDRLTEIGPRKRRSVYESTSSNAYRRSESSKLPRSLLVAASVTTPRRKWHKSLALARICCVSLLPSHKSPKRRFHELSSPCSMILTSETGTRCESVLPGGWRVGRLPARSVPDS